MRTAIPVRLRSRHPGGMEYCAARIRTPGVETRPGAVRVLEPRGERDPVYHATMLDRHTAAELSFDVAELVDALVDAHGAPDPGDGAGSGRAERVEVGRLTSSRHNALPAVRPWTHLMVFGFGADSSLEGQLVGALERMEAGGALRILDTLFVGREAETGELVAIGQQGRGSPIMSLLGARLDAAERQRLTARALDAATTGVPVEAIRELEGMLQPGEAVAAVLVEHVWARAMQDALMRTGGTLLGGEFVDATELRQVADELITAARRRSDSPQAPR
jgi:hypothetical protein